VRTALATPVFEYALALYASEAYLAEYGEPRTLAEMSQHRLNYYIESALQIDELDLAVDELPPTRPSMRSTSVFAHLAATVAGAGIGLMPDYVARLAPGLRRILAEEYHHPISYWAVTREESLRNPAVAAAFRALVEYDGVRAAAAA
jgi:DNA-binding transcriptional LysR family regulator